MALYFRRGDGVEVSVLEKYTDTVKRLLQDGWERIEGLSAKTTAAPAETEDAMRARIRAELLAEMAGTPATTSATAPETPVEAPVDAAPADVATPTTKGK